MAAITKDDVLNQLTLVVGRYGPGWVDPNAVENEPCQNIYEDEEGVTRRCIAAEVLHDFGVTDDELLTYNELSVRDTVDALRPGEFDDEALKLLTAAQRLQDNYVKWGTIFEALDALR